METKVYTTIDRTGWPSGVWDDEPDKMQWPDTATELPCLAVRHPTNGHWCGYAGVTEGHPLFGKDYDTLTIRVYGGLTYSALCDSNGLICHIPAPGEPDHVWWFGFDCAHSGDISPAYAGRIWPGNVYRTLAFVQAECTRLAAQLHQGE